MKSPSSDSIENLDEPPPYDNYAVASSSSSGKQPSVTRPLVSRPQRGPGSTSEKGTEDKQSSRSSARSYGSQSESESDSGSSVSGTEKDSEGKAWSTGASEDEGSGVEMARYQSPMPEVVRSAQSITYLDRTNEEGGFDDVGVGAFI